MKPEAITLTYRQYLARKYGRFGGVAMDTESLADHDKRFHPDGYQEGDRCKLRESLNESDAPDAALASPPAPSAEYEAVVAEYTNPDGTKKPGWMKAPNGKDTNLTERQWVQVRTPSFKKWFGDWERKAELDRAVDFALNGDPVAAITGDEFPQTGDHDLIDRVAEYYASLGGKVEHPELGEVVIDRNSVKSSLGHGIGREKAAAFAAVPDVIRKGFVFDRQRNWKNRGVDSFVLVAPIKIGNDKYVCEAIVEQKGTGKERRFYLHEVNLQSLLSDTIKTPAGGAGIGKPARPVRSILAKLAAEFKPDSVSKVVDGNGEPKVVYHGTAMDISRFYPGFDNVIWTTPSRDYADIYADPARHTDPENDGVVMELFVSAKKVADIGDINSPYDEAGVKRIAAAAGGTAGGLMERAGNYSYGYLYELNEHLMKMAKENGFDGFAAIEGGLDEWGGGFPEKVATIGVFRDTQLKSATDNTGAFSPDDPDIRH